jgi:hypothetical protein
VGGRGDAILMTGQDLAAAEITLIGNRAHLVAPERSLCSFGHRRQLLAIVPVINHIMRHDQVGLGMVLSKIFRTFRYATTALWV